MSKRLFLKKFICNRKEIGSIIPSSPFLAKKVIQKSYIERSSVIIELWAGTWSFTKIIFEYLWKNKWNKKVFIIEKDIDLYNLLLKKFPDFKKYIFNFDILELNDFFENKKISKVDLIISGLPFKSLPIDIFLFIVKWFLPQYSKKDTIFVQFSYFKWFYEMLIPYFKKIDIQKCILNIPRAYIFKCTHFKENKCW